ncbi:DUF5615 family PIN-like protein [Desulfonema magnum]|uniref:DUF615 n=1 Tax=Desulfonema magnum TaxID=45655 RepID=A0A975BSH9_9BACT|nr:DUF5615 family PIN-like protein [Desulfonema magnum]QTA90632.1 DUF615 [Desulfonema magnum]
MEKTSGTAGITILADHDIEGKARLLYHTLRKEGWTELCSVKMILFADVGLADNSTDREVWRFAQKNGMILLTGNRNMENEDSLEQTLRDENTPESLPVLTVSRAGRLDGRVYRQRCAEKIMEIAVYLEDYLGTARIFIP